MTYQTPICKNDRCSKLVPVSKNPGVRKLFCSPLCARRYHARMWYQRDKGTNGEGLVFVNELGQAQVNRRMPASSRAADVRWKNHLAACPIHKGPCAARSDPYGRQRLCIVAAVFSDDWTQLKDAEAGKPGRRFSTTIDGRWLADLSAEEREALVKRENVLPATRFITDEEREKVIAAGGAVFESREESEEYDLLREVNEGLPLSN